MAVLRATFASASAPPLVELAAAAVHLVDRIGQGGVAAGADTTALLGEAYASLGDPAPADRMALVERLDACASGLGNVPLAEDATPARHASAPPLLALREDGTTVLPGAFAPASPGRVAPLQAGAAASPPMPIGDLAGVAAAMETACLRLAAQVGTLELLAGEDLRRLVSELAATSVAIDGQRRALAAWLEANGGGAGQ